MCMYKPTFTAKLPTLLTLVLLTPNGCPGLSVKVFVLPSGWFRSLFSPTPFGQNTHGHVSEIWSLTGGAFHHHTTYDVHYMWIDANDGENSGDIDCDRGKLKGECSGGKWL